MKIKSILNEVATPPQFKKLFAAFPADTNSWKFATDEMRDIAKFFRETYNEFHQTETPIQSLNFKSFTTPSEWNSESQKFIVDVWKKMNTATRSYTLKHLKQDFPKYF